MSHKTLVPWLIRLLLSLACVCAVPRAAGAQQLRVADGTAGITQWRGAGEVVATVRTGWVLDVIDRDGDWFWVILPPDAHGTRRVGWLRAQLANGGLRNPAMPLVQMVNGPGAGQIEQTVPFQATAPRQARPVGRWSLAGTGGVSFTASTGGFVAGNLDYALTPRLSVSGEVGYLTSALSETTRTHVESMARQTELVLALVTGRTLEVTPSIAVPTLAFTAGARVVGPESGRARPYATVGLGVARLAPTVRLLAGTDDVTGAFVRVEDLPASETGPLVTAGGGMLVRVVEGVAVDIGYRFTRISSGGGLNLNRLAFGVGYRF